MNLYALNVTPVNGWATWQGSGRASMVLAGSGKSANVVRGAGTARMELQASGKGVRRAMGYSLPKLVLTSSGHGSLRSGVGGAATLILAWHYGQGGILVRSRGTARLQFNVDANSLMGRSAVASAGMQMLMRGEARTYRLVHGAALASVELDISNRISASVRDMPFVFAPRSRQFCVPRESRRFVVPHCNDRTPGFGYLLRYPDGTIAFDLIFDAMLYGADSTAGAIDDLERIVTIEMPGDAWAGTP
ncbi:MULTISPECIES: hypothetical protein [Burkholderia]|uniref:Uncharacterized protein n=1 Tax=Burkholderia aenigmatica TaxID=2015348 RepID=A0A6J5JKG0_9BURK|nr:MULTISPECIES: hypothetical protein [Burkholderia]CAB3972344.1 hypothetical protein BLA3211_06921 [Burkholderia aenigmatica]